MQFTLAALSVLIASAAALQPTQHATFSAPGASSLGSNKLGCVNIKPAGHNSQNVCLKHICTDGFTMQSKDSKTGVVFECSIKNAVVDKATGKTSGTGACGPGGLSATVDLTGGTGTCPTATGPTPAAKLPAEFLTAVAIKGDAAAPVKAAPAKAVGTCSGKRAVEFTS